jgi:glycosyltransferase involved in cell wall biosynthesis
LKVVSVMTTTSRGGAEFAAVSLLDALAARGHEAVMLSDLPGITRDTAVRAAPVALGPKLARRTWPALALGAPLLLARLARALRREAPYDVLLLHFKKEQLLASALPRRLRPVLAWAEWGPVPAQLRSGPAKRAYRAAARPVAAVLAVSEGTRASLLAAGLAPERVHVVPNVVSASEFRPLPEARAAQRRALGVPDDAFVIGCVSRFHPKKRNDVAIDAAIALLTDGGAPVHLVLAGEGETEAELRARSAPLGDAVHFVPTPGFALPQVVAGWDVAVFCPSPTEGAPRAVIAPMLCGLPCVATAAEGVRELIVPGTGAIAEPENDPAAVARLLRGYRDDPERRAREGAQARRHAAALHDAGDIATRVETLLGAR